MNITILIFTLIVSILPACNNHMHHEKMDDKSTASLLDAARDYAINLSPGNDARNMSREEAFSQFLDQVKVELPASAIFLRGIYNTESGETGSSIFLEIDPKEMGLLLNAVKQTWNDPKLMHLKFGDRKILIHPDSPAAKQPFLSAFGAQSVELWLTNEKTGEESWIELLADPKTGLFLYTWSRP